VEDWTGQGKTIARVRIIDRPPTDYQRWSLWCARWHMEAGEDITYLYRQTANGLGLRIPPGDWQMFDHSRLVLMAFTPAGEPAGKTLVTDPTMIRRYEAWRAVAMGQASVLKAIPV
jgi:hypothetical protein